MKVVHISTSDSGGAGMAAYRLHHALLSIGVESHMLVAVKTRTESEIEIAYPSPHLLFQPHKNRLVRKVQKMLRKRGYLLTQAESVHRQLVALNETNPTVYFTSPVTVFDISNHPLVKDADLVHLHWIADFVDYRSFFSNIDKPVVWTFHDENIGYGGFHYQRDRDLNYERFKEIEDTFCSIKRESLACCSNIYSIALSRKMSEFLKSLDCFAPKKSYIIHNSVDYRKYRILNKDFSRELFNIPQNHTVFSFCANGIGDPRKGLRELLSALERLEMSNVSLLCIGPGELPRPTKVNTICVGSILNENVMSALYACSDFFVMPSFQEAFAQTPLEALACGVPVIAFPCSGTEELITSENGVRCGDFTVDSLIEGILCAMTHQYKATNLRQDVIDRFSPEVIANQYLNVYTEALHLS